MYTWQHEGCEEHTIVIRTVDDMEVEPTIEEQVCDCTECKWQRIMCAPSMKRGYNWGPGKGHW